MILVILAVSGILVGFLSTFFGVGGGSLLVPALYLAFPDISAQTVIGCSLGVITLITPVNVWLFIREGRRPSFKIIFSIGIFSVISAVASSLVAVQLPPMLVKKIFGICLFFYCFKLTFGKQHFPSEEEWNRNLSKYPWVKFFIAGFCGGFVAGLTGLGGGLVIIPLFISLLHMPYRLIPLYSNGTMFFSASAATLTYMLAKVPAEIASKTPFPAWQIGHINLAIILLLSITVFITAHFGVKFNNRVSDHDKKYLLLVFLFLIAAHVTFF
jgi:uncharacterized membrane protein YfcA